MLFSELENLRKETPRKGFFVVLGTNQRIPEKEEKPTKVEIDKKESDRLTKLVSI